MTLNYKELKKEFRDIDKKIKKQTSAKIIAAALNKNKKRVNNESRIIGENNERFN